MTGQSEEKCDCIIGVAYMLNHEEGPAWIKAYVHKSSSEPLEDDWSTLFQHCPKCGAKNDHTGRDETLFLEL